jgi:hypothetical protein
MAQCYKFIVGLLILALHFNREATAQQLIPSDSVLVSASDGLKRQMESDFLMRKALSHERAKQFNWTLRTGGGADEALTELMDLMNGMPVYYSTNNTNAAQTTSTNHILPFGSSGLNLTGQDLSIGIWDGGAVRASHQELTGRVTQVDGATALSWHATHVAGTLAASGQITAARGMAPEAQIKAHDWNNDNAEMVTAAVNGLLVSNHSYGQVSGWAWGNWSGGGNQWHWFGNPTFSTTEDWTFGMYESKAAQWDAIMYNNPYYLIVKSVGNDRGEGPATPIQHRCLNAQFQWVVCNDIRPQDGGINGYECIPTYGTAKNILSIGAVNDIPGGYQQASDVVVASFSSWGPTDDGRIKPDLVANGVTLYSSHSSTNASYANSSGTSMAAPNVAGSLLLLQQHFFQTNGVHMSSAALKGLAIHTADEAGTAPGPDYQHGWGLLNAKKAALAITDSEHYAFIDSTLQQGQSHQYDFFANGIDPVKATITWIDTSGPVLFALNNPSPRLVNDLDIRIRSYQCDTVFFPWTLDPSNPGADAFSADNFRDNVEVIGDLVLPKGNYYVEVTHKSNLYSSKQRYALMIQSSPYTAEPYDTVVYLSAPVVLPFPEGWNMPSPVSIWLSNDPKIDFQVIDDSVWVDAISMGFDTVYIASCEVLAGGCNYCDTISIALDIRSCNENVSAEVSSDAVDMLPSCSDDDGWFYFKDPITNATLLGIKPNDNDFNPSLLRIDASTVGNFQQPPPLAAALMPYMLTIEAPGSFDINGGLSIKLFYPTAQKEPIEDDYVFFSWFKHPGNKANVLEEFNNQTFSPQLLTVQEAGTVNGVDYVVFEGITSFSTFGFAGWDNPAVLPVTWSSFEVQADNRIASLKWATASELNNRGFFVEHAMEDLVFKEIGFVDGNGTKALPSAYSFTHLIPANGQHYYRIRQLDFDGTVDYSVIRSLEYFSEASSDFKVFPNPSSGQIRVESIQPLGFVAIYDATGTLLIRYLLEEKEANVDVTKFASGILFVQTTHGSVKVMKY